MKAPSITDQLLQIPLRSHANSKPSADNLDKQHNKRSSYSDAIVTYCGSPNVPLPPPLVMTLRLYRPCLGPRLWASPPTALSFYLTCRRSHRNFLVELKQSNAERHLNRLVTRVYRGHLYGRKPARKLRAQRAAAWWGPQEWEVDRRSIKPVIVALLSFFMKYRVESVDSRQGSTYTVGVGKGGLVYHLEGGGMDNFEVVNCRL